jgi:hypothetical protein
MIPAPTTISGHVHHLIGLGAAIFSDLFLALIRGGDQRQLTLNDLAAG